MSEVHTFETLGGKHHYSFRQSWLGTFSMCPEQARQQMLGLVEDSTTDAAAYGTSLHAVIEENLNEVIRGRDSWNVDDSYDLFLSTFYDLAAQDNFRWTKLSKGSIEQHGRMAVQQFFDLLPTFDPVATEIPFREVPIYEDDERVINLEGTIDFEDAKLGLVDWKTGGRAYEPWEKKRFATQPTVYTYAYYNSLHQADYSVSGGPFTYFVFVRGGEVQRLSVHRGLDDWLWLRDRCLSIAKLIEADLDVWPLRDEGWHCSPLWCPVFDRCKGQRMPKDWPANL